VRAASVPPREPPTHALAHTLDTGWKFVSEMVATVAIVLAVRK